MRNVLIALTVSATAISSADAAIITRSFSFTASNYYDANGSDVPPHADTSATFSITFDNDADIPADLNSTDGLVVHSVSLPGMTDFKFHYFKSNDVITVATSLATYGYRLNAGVNGYGFSIFDVSSENPADYSASGGAYALSGQSGIYYSRSASVTAIEAPAAVPDCAVWVMFIGGFGLIGAAMRRRQKVAVTFA
jgi:hypothetical protein